MSHEDRTRQALTSVASQATWGIQGFITFVMAGTLLPQKRFGCIVVNSEVELLNSDDLLRKVVLATGLQMPALLKGSGAA